MKLKTKLIPLTGLAAIGATIAPIAMTSCGNGSTGWIDLTQKYNSTVKALDNQTLTTKNANKAYFGDETEGWKSEDDVIAQFKDDYFWYGHKNVEYRTEDDITFSIAKVKFDEIHVGHQTYTPSVTTTNPYQVPTFSFKMEYEYEWTEDYESSSTRKQNETGTVTCVNVPYMVEYHDDPVPPMETGTKWVIQIPEEILRDNESSLSRIIWSYNVDKNLTETITYPEAEYVTTSHDNVTYYTGCGQAYIGEFVRQVAVKSLSHYLFSVQHAE